MGIGTETDPLLGGGGGAPNQRKQGANTFGAPKSYTPNKQNPIDQLKQLWQSATTTNTKHDGVPNDKGNKMEHSPPSKEALGAKSISYHNDDAVNDEKSTQKNSLHSLLQTIAGVAGNVLEWYDFAVFGFFGDIIADVFFPPQAGHAALIESFAIFGGAFLMRPVGGVLMGYIGDTYGRKEALELSIFLMAFPTFAMGCLPSFNQVGWLSVVLLLIVRLMQGLSVGGQLMSSLVFTVEKRPKNKWGLYGSYVMAAANIGTLLGGVIAYTLRQTLTAEQLHVWGWRIPFLCGILVSLSGLYLRWYGDNTVHGDEVAVERPQNPIKMALAPENRRSLLSATLVPMMWASGFYLTFVWMAIFMETLVQPPVEQAFAINSISLFLSVCIFFPFAGMASDVYGRKPTMAVGGFFLMVMSPWMVSIIGKRNPWLCFLCQSMMGVALSLWGAPMLAWLVESFPPEARLTSVQIGYNLAQAFVGGLSPSVATYLVDTFGLESPGYILTVVAALSLTGLFTAKNEYQPNSEEDQRRNTNSEAESIPSGTSRNGIV
mmetsp:Transcript_2143/g.3026  ORF Transcript_2143/g.3026 Transcript_2143/m.3026 type:complete len:546 (+) Transcript_2143:85-1722(+)